MVTWKGNAGQGRARADEVTDLLEPLQPGTATLPILTSRIERPSATTTDSLPDTSNGYRRHSHLVDP